MTYPYRGSGLKDRGFRLPKRQKYHRRGKRYATLVPGTDPWLWALLCDEIPSYLDEENPFVDRIDYDVKLIACHRMVGTELEDTEPSPASRKPPMEWEEHLRRRAARANKRYMEKKLKAVNTPIANAPSIEFALTSVPTQEQAEPFDRAMQRLTDQGEDVPAMIARAVENIKRWRSESEAKKRSDSTVDEPR